MKTLLVLMATAGAAGIALALLRLAAERSAPAPRCEVCGAEVSSPDPLDAAVACRWHWAPGGDA